MSGKSRSAKGYGGLLLIVLVFITAQHCESPAPVDEEDRLLAEVHDKSLYLSDMEGMIPEGASSHDSALIINAFVQRWIREALLLHEAERNIPKDLNIDKLVRDYRASLIRNTYEQQLVKKLLDSTITQAQLIEFYERNKEQYQLETPIVRCYFIKVPAQVPEANKLGRYWSDPERYYDQLVAYCNTYASSHHLVDSTWQELEDIAIQLPKGMLTVDNIRSKQKQAFTFKDSEYQYYFKAFELKNKKELAPLSYIEDQARKVILHRRKIKLLERKKEDLYEIGLRRNNVQVMIE